MPLRPARVCRFAIRCQEKEETNHEEEIDIYDPGDSDPYTHEYILMHEPFRRIPLSYYPDVDYGFYPPCLVFGIGLLRDEAVAYAEEQGILAGHLDPNTQVQHRGSYWLVARREQAEGAGYNEGAGAARERRGYFYWAMNESMYPQRYSPLMYKDSSTQVLKCYCFVSARVLL
ncbi:hypothetical protein BDZ89DRAFT_1166816 [Hymenopellis radicata]|nr:hypothetical protein BDZ89DRAFT_1166816 [Hymenopellis radicata]